MLALALAALVAFASTDSVPTAPTRWVEDHAGFLSPPVRDALDRRLEAYEQSTGHQVVVWIGDTIGGAPLDDWAVRTFAAWQVGRKGIDDGLVMFILAADRAIDIEVGYGLEERVTDALASRVIREVMAPRLQAGERDAAVTAGVDAILTAIEGKPWHGEPAAQVSEPSPWDIVVGILVVVGFVILLVKYPRAAVVLLAGMRRGGRGGLGGFGGRGGGGFSGGGGRSGGGGARGGW